MASHSLTEWSQFLNEISRCAPCICKEERKRGRELVALESRMSSVKVQMPQMQEAWMGSLRGTCGLRYVAAAIAFFGVKHFMILHDALGH